MTDVPRSTSIPLDPLRVAEQDPPPRNPARVSHLKPAIKPKASSLTLGQKLNLGVLYLSGKEEVCLLSQKKKKRLSEREGGQFLILPPESATASGEDGALSIRTPGSSLHPKGRKSLMCDHSPTQENPTL